MMDYVARILRSEVHLLQSSIGTTLEAQVSNAVANLTIAALIISGAICILCASICCCINGCHGGRILASQAWLRSLSRGEERSHENSNRH